MLPALNQRFTRQTERPAKPICTCEILEVNFKKLLDLITIFVKESDTMHRYVRKIMNTTK